MITSRPGPLKAVDLGCGTGAFTSRLQRYGFDLHGVDISPQSVARDQSVRYSVPATLSADQWALGGTWTVSSEGAVLQQPRGKIVYRFNGRDLHLVLGPAKDGQAIHFKVRLDGADPGANKGADIGSDGAGVVTEQRLYQLIRLAQPGAEHTVEIEFLDPGVEAFSFTFG